jgi:hypothetical protein
MTIIVIMLIGVHRMTNKDYVITITTTSKSAKVNSTSIQLSAKDRKRAIMKLFDNHLRYSDAVDIEQLLEDNNTIVFTFKEQ